MNVQDQPYSWVVAVAGSVMYFIMYGLSRTTGLLFVETLTTFNTDRETASFPFILACALRYLTGPIAGALAGRLGLRLVILLGSLMACIGVGGCYLATTITAVSVLWGGLFGLGSGISSTQLPQINNLYFTKHLTTANGISYAGAAIAGFVLPPIIECILNEYDIAGTYLLLSGIALHSIPAAILLKEPETEKLPMISFEIPDEIREKYKRRVSDLSVIYDNTKQRARRLSQMYTSDMLSGRTSQTKNGDNTGMGISYKHNGFSTKIHSSNRSSESTNCRNSNSVPANGNILQNPNASQGLVNANIQTILPLKTNKTASLKRIKECEQIKDTEIKIASPEHCSLKRKFNFFSHTEMAEPLSDIKGNEPIETKDTRRPSNISGLRFSNISRQASNCSRSSFEKRETSGSFTNSVGKNSLGVCYIECAGVTENHEEPPNMCLNDLSIFWDVKFLLISFTASINGFHCFVLPTILIDFCMDKGISMTDATYTMMAFSICDMVGRVGFGWVTDRKYMTKANFCAVCFLGMTASLAFFVWSTELIPMFLVQSVLGLSLGVHTPLPAGLITEYIEPSKHTMANASFDVLGVPFLLLTPIMIGYFRDELGSYDMFVFLLSIISFVCALMVLLLPYIERRQQEKKEMKLRTNSTGADVII